MQGPCLQGGVTGSNGGIRLVHLQVGGSQIAVQLAQALAHSMLPQEFHRLNKQ